VARPHPGASPIPLHFSDEEMTLLLELSRPIEPAQRSAFLDAWPPRSGSRRAGRASFTRPRGGSRGISGRRPICPPTRRRPCTAATPPEGLGGRLKGEVQSWNTMGEAAIIGGERPGFLRMAQRWSLPTKASIGVAGMSWVLAVSRPPCVASVPKRSQILARLLRAPETPRMTTHEA
jgi:hypothetical protein